MFGWPISGFHIVGFEIYFLTNPCFTPEGFGRVAVLIPPCSEAERGDLMQTIQMSSLGAEHVWMAYIRISYCRV